MEVLSPCCPKQILIDLGYDEQYMRSAKDLIDNIKTDAKGIRSGAESNICECLDNSEGFSVSRQDAFSGTKALIITIHQDAT